MKVSKSTQSARRSSERLAKRSSLESEDVRLVLLLKAFVWTTGARRNGLL